MPDNSVRREAEEQLAKKLQQGDREAMSIIYDQYAPVLLGLIFRLIQDKDAAEEVLQEAFITIWQKKESYNSASMGLLTWMLMISRDTALASVKQRKQMSFSGNGEIYKFAGNKAETEPEPDLNQNGAVWDLTPKQQAALDLVYLKDYSCEEAAGALGISVLELVECLKMTIKKIGEETAS